MKIAVLIYGRLNKCVDTYKSIREALGNRDTFDFFMSSDASSAEHLKNFIQLYSPVSYTNEKINHTCNLLQYTNNVIVRGVNIDNMIRHFINKKRVFDLLTEHMNSTGTHYDRIVVLRIDLLFQSSFNFTDCQENTIYVPVGYDYEGLNDRVVYGSFESIKKYCSIFETMEYLLESKRSTLIHPETLNLANVMYHSVNIERIDVSCSILRDILPYKLSFRVKS